MRATIILIAILFFVSNCVTAQIRTIYGHVIYDGDLGPIPGVWIQNKDKVLLGKTGMDGRFKIDMPQNTQTLLLSFIGFERAKIKLKNDCDTIEIVMMESGTYDFISSRKVDRLRLKRFNKLPELHLQAYKKGLFMKESACYTRQFEPEKPQLDSIGNEMSKREKQIKLTFEKLNVGDTVKIPFSDWGGYRADGTDRTTLSYYSIFADMKHYNCVITAIILSKDRHKRGYHKRGYNIVCQVVNCGNCKDPSVFRDKVMKPGEVFDYNMRYFKILDE